MFRPDRTYKKLAQQYGSTAYIYPDGVWLWEKRKVKAGKFETILDINHYYPAEIKLYSRDYSKNWGQGDLKCNRIVVHNPAMLLSGLERVEVVYNDASERSKERGLRATLGRFYAPNGMEWEGYQIDCLGTSLTFQPSPFGFGAYVFNGPKSIRELIEKDKAEFSHYEIHGELPELEPEAV